MDSTNLNKDRRDRKSIQNKVDLTVFGKVPPQSKDLEEAILGAILLKKPAFDVAIEILKPECFYVESHQRVYKAMCALAQRGQPIDLLMLVEELRKTEELEIVGGPYALSKLTNSVVSDANLEAHCRIVLQKYMLRHLIDVGSMMVQKAFEDRTDVFDLIDESEKSLSEVNQTTKSSYTKLTDGIVEVVRKIEDLRHSSVELTGVNTGFKDVNRLTCGWQQPDFIILAARPSVGKTALALNFAMSAAKSGTGVGFFSLEMSKAQLIQRLLSIESEMPLEKIIRGKLSDDDMKDLYKLGVNPLVEVPIYIDDTGGINIYELRSKARKMVKNGVGLIIIDYLQLMSGLQNSRPDNREQEISKISRDLKRLCKELEIPIIALSQLSRDVEKRSGEVKMPVLSDLRESGAIEQDADIVMFMYRPEYYGKNTDEHGNMLNGETCIKFAKHRSGALDIIKLRAELAIQKFHDTESQPVQLGISQANNSFSFPSKPNKMATLGTDDAPF